MRVFVGCEFSGIVREAFARRGHDAWSCDFLPSEIPGKHIQDDVLKHLKDGWDLFIAHPPCTYLSVAGYHYSLKDSKRMKQTFEALEFFKKLYNAPIKKICLENPISMVSTLWRKPDQIIQPYYWGVSERKTTCLWIKNLPPLIPNTNIKVAPRGFIVRKTGPKKGQRYNYYWRQGKNGHDRSRTFNCIAEAMAAQWG